MLPDKLRKLRAGTKLTQSEFAQKIDVARTTYAMYEQGKREPDYETLRNIAKFHDVSLDYLLGETDSKERKNKITIIDEEFEAFVNDPSLERWYKELPENEEEDLQALKQMWEIIKRNKK